MGRGEGWEGRGGEKGREGKDPMCIFKFSLE